MGQLIHFENRRLRPPSAPAYVGADDYLDAGILPDSLQAAISRTLAAGVLLEHAVERLRARFDLADAAIDAIENPETRHSLRELTAMNRKALVRAVEKMSLEIDALSELRAMVLGEGVSSPP